MVNNTGQNTGIKTMINLSSLNKYGLDICVQDTWGRDVDTGVYYVSIFARRPISDGIPPLRHDVLIDVSNGDTTVESIKIGDVVWGLWTHWRPSMQWLVQQELTGYKDENDYFGEAVPVGIPTETPEEKEALDSIGKKSPYDVGAHCSGLDKPAFTQAMVDATGAKHDSGKHRYDLLPPVAIDELAKVLSFGAEKYAPNSWQSVPDASNRYRAALLRHTFAIQRGELIDAESGLLHSALAMCNAAFITELEVGKK